MGLADQRDAIAQRPQVITQSQLGGTQRHGIVGGAVAGHVTAGVEGHARRRADRRLAIGTFEAYDAFSQPVDMRGLEGRMAGTAQVIRPPPVGPDEKKVARSEERRVWNERGRKCRSRWAPGNEKKT